MFKDATHHSNFKKALGKMFLTQKSFLGLPQI